MDSNSDGVEHLITELERTPKIIVRTRTNTEHVRNFLLFSTVGSRFYNTLGFPRKYC